MPRKIYDIKPPKIAKKVDKEIKELLGREPKTTVTKRQSRSKKEKKFTWVPVFSTAVVLALVVFVYLFFKLPKATIEIWPNVETLSFQKTITINKAIDTVDSTLSIIPAKYFEITKDDSQDFPATGNATNEGKASGTITVYNKFEPVTPFTLKTGTHFMSDSGKLFVASQKIVIPAARKSGSKITPGSVQVRVEAAEGGDSYNIAPSNFSVPGLKGTAYYYSVYATSTSPMTGGYAGKTKKVTDDDVQSAKEVLVKKATDDAVNELKAQIPSDYILLDSAISSDTISSSTSTKVGTIAQNFTYQANIKVSALAFKKSDLDKLAQDYIISQMPDGKILLENSFKIDYSTVTVDVSGGKATLNINFSSGVYPDINKNSLAISLFGRNANQINEIINNSLGSQISSVKVNFWPFWVTSAPKNQKAVNVELKF